MEDYTGTIFVLAVAVCIFFGVSYCIWHNRKNNAKPSSSTQQESIELQEQPQAPQPTEENIQVQGGITVTHRISWLSERIMSCFAGQPTAIQQPKVTTTISGPVPAAGAKQVAGPSSSYVNNQTQASNAGGAGPMSTGNDSAVQPEPDKATSAPKDTEAEEATETQVATEDNETAQTEEMEATTDTTADKNPPIVPELRTPGHYDDLENIIEHGEMARQRRGFE